MPESIHEHDRMPGVVHWTARHPNIGVEVSSYYLVEERVLLDPIMPPDGLDWFEGREPRHALLTNRHHLRNCADFAERFGITVHASRPGMHEFEGSGVEVRPFDFGDELPGGVKAHEIGVLCPDETALEIPAHSALAVADGVMRYADALHFVPEEHLGDYPDAIRSGLKQAYARIAEAIAFDNLLLAHGEPIVGGAREALSEFAAT